MPSQNEFVFRANVTGPHKTWLRLDKDATCMKVTSRQGPGWSQVKRRVTVDNATKRILADEVVAEISDPFVRFDRPVDLLTILHYDGELLAREVILRGGETNRHGGLKDVQWRPTTPVEQT